MYFQANAVAIVHHGHVASNHGGDIGRKCRITNLLHHGNILIVYDGVYRQISLDVVSMTSLGNLLQVVNVEVIG